MGGALTRGPNFSRIAARSILLNIKTALLNAVTTSFTA